MVNVIMTDIKHPIVANEAMFIVAAHGKFGNIQAIRAAQTVDEVVATMCEILASPAQSEADVDLDLRITGFLNKHYYQ